MEKIRAMKRASAHVDCILKQELPAWLHEGITERQLFTQLCDTIRAKGKYDLSFDPIVAFGAGGAEPHHEPTNAKLTPGSPILIDCGAIFDGWCSDCTRMFSFGETSDFFHKKFTKLLLIHEKTLSRFLPGAKCSELDKYVRSELEKDSSFFIHTLGHGVGKEVHIPPRISSNSIELLHPGDVVTCEPGLYFQNKFGIRIEDQLVIQKKGVPELLTTSPRKLCVIDAWGGVTYQQ
jgi:Xaa-Pro aminopeptidase